MKTQTKKHSAVYRLIQRAKDHFEDINEWACALTVITFIETNPDKYHLRFNHSNPIHAFCWTAAGNQNFWLKVYNTLMSAGILPLSDRHDIEEFQVYYGKVDAGYIEKKLNPIVTILDENVITHTANAAREVIFTLGQLRVIDLN